MDTLFSQYSDEFVRENYIKAADPEDPYNYRSRAFTYAAKIPMWAGLLAGTRVTVVYLMSQSVSHLKFSEFSVFC